MILRISALAAALALSITALASAADTVMTYQLVAQNGSGETGTVVLIPTADGKGTIVQINTVNPTAALQPTHVHKGPCAKLDPKPTYPLASLQKDASISTPAGVSTTTLAAVPISTLTDGDWAVNVHKSPQEAAIYVACVDLKPQR